MCSRSETGFGGLWKWKQRDLEGSESESACFCSHRAQQPSQMIQSVCWGDPVAPLVGSQSQVHVTGNAAQVQGRQSGPGHRACSFEWGGGRNSEHPVLAPSGRYRSDPGLSQQMSTS